MKISQKLILGFVGVAVLSAIVGTISVFQNKNTQRISEKEVYRSISHLDDVWILMEAQEHMEIAAKDHLFLEAALKERRADYFYEKERLEETYQKFYRESCIHAKPWLEKYYENIRKYITRIEEAFELYNQGADLEVIKEKVREASKYIEIAHEDALEPIIKHVHDDHIEPAKKDIAKGINRTTITIITMSGIAVFLAIGLGFFIARSISNPIQKLHKGTEIIGSGNLDYRIGIDTRDEIGQLSRAFDKMTGNLKKTTTSIVELSREVLQRKEAEEKASQAAEEWLKTFDAISDFLFILDKDYEFVKVNKSFCDALKVKPEDLIGKKCYEVLHKSKKPWPNCPFSKSLEDKRAHTEEVDDPGIGKLLLVSTSPLFDEKGEIIGAVHIAKDISELKKTEEQLKEAYKELKETQAQLIQSAKMSSIGQLAAGVAHEINNPLTVILAEAEMLLKDKPKDKDTQDATKTVVEQGKRIKQIIERLLEFSRRRTFKQEPLDINSVVEKSVSLLTYQSKIENIKIIKELGTGLPKILGDSGQLQEVLLNIMLNAVQAMGKGGTLTIKSRKETVKEFGRRKTDIFKQGQKILAIEFKDTGCGMDEETLFKIFDPFFSTKEKNTGLGLSICYAIMQNHNGDIEINSQKGKGSVFIVKLPVFEGGKK